jgi:hypothetical protein
MDTSITTAYKCLGTVMYPWILAGEGQENKYRGDRGTGHTLSRKVLLKQQARALVSE